MVGDFSDLVAGLQDCRFWQRPGYARCMVMSGRRREASLLCCCFLPAQEGCVVSVAVNNVVAQGQRIVPRRIEAVDGAQKRFCVTAKFTARD